MNLVPITQAVKLKKKRVSPFEGEKGYLSTGDLNVNVIKKLVPVTYEERPSRADLALDAGDLIVARMQATQKVMLISEDEADMIVSTGFMTLVPKDGWDGEFLYFYLNSPFFQDQKDRLCTGATQKAINNTKFKEITIPEISLEDQRRIVQELRSLDALLKKRRQSLQLLDDYLKSVFLEMFGDPVLNPKGWDECNLEDICSKVIDCPHSTPKYSDNPTGYLCIRSSDLQAGFIDYSSTKVVPENEYQFRIKRETPKKKDIIYCREGARYGNLGIILNDKHHCLGQRTMLFRSNEKTTAEFLWGLMSSEGIFHQAERIANGAASPHINVKDIRKYKCFTPPIDLQKKYSFIFNTCIGSKTKMQAQSQDLETSFKAMMQEAFTK